MADKRVIKRYANRKLYDTLRSCYVTLDNISVMICSGEEVQIIDNQSGEDLTGLTLAQIIFEIEKKKQFMPLGLLRDIIRSRSDALAELYRDSVGRVQATALEFRDSVQKATDRTVDAIQDTVVRRPIVSAKELLTQTQRSLDDLQAGMEQRFKGGVGVLSREVAELRAKLTELEERLNRDG
jgi:polyhydroxyalkanoate synthesis repressor PhaR